MSETMDAGDLWAFLHCGDIDDCDEQAECFLKSTLDGMLAHPEEHRFFVKRGLSQMLQAIKARFKREAALAAPSPAPASMPRPIDCPHCGYPPGSHAANCPIVAVVAQPRSPEQAVGEWYKWGIAERDGEVERLREALRRAQTALNDWITTYADDQCSEESVKEAWARIADGGGTLAYVAHLQADIDAALAAALQTARAAHAAGVREERERAAKLAEEEMRYATTINGSKIANRIAVAIRGQPCPMT